MKNNQEFKCAYCGKERPRNELKEGSITYLGLVWTGIRWKSEVKREVRLYCADNHCHGYDQMGHEG